MNEKSYRLSSRLLTIANLVRKNSVVVDIGSDHGLLIKYLIDRQIINKGYATENKPGPFSLLKSSLADYDNITCYLADGLNNLPDGVDTIIIAGMGGNLISNILRRDLPHLNSNIKNIILAANNNEYRLRKQAHACRYKIDYEIIIEERNHFYEICTWEKGEITYQEDDFLFGPLLRKQKDPTFLKKWTKRKEEIKRLLIRPLPINRINKLEKELEKINKL